MRKKVNLIIGLMTVCAMLVLCLQVYWNYAAYQNHTRVFKSDINNALGKAVDRLMDLRRDEFAAQYKRWLNDTSLVTITCKYSDERSKGIIFHLMDTHPPYKGRLPFSIGFQQFKLQLDHITPEAKQYFINHFVDNTIHNDLKSGTAYYYTQRLGDMMVEAYAKDKLDLGLLKEFYTNELAKVDIENGFQFETGQDKIRSFSTPNEAMTVHPFSTRSFLYGFHGPNVSIHAYFPKPEWVFLQKMKWVLLGSFLLVGMTIGCFTYTVKTMLSQHQLAELKDNFVNNMTHELKTPVATISIAAEAIQDFNLTKTSADEYLGIIRHQAGNLSSLIDQILKSMMNEKALITVNREPVNIEEVLRHCIHQSQPQLNLAHATLSMEISGEDSKVLGDRIHLSNVFGNLIDNAIKYSHADPQIKVKAMSRDSYVEIEVTNDGPGIPSEYQDKIFDRFFRVPSGNLHNVKGYGLGLSYAREIVKQLGGELTLHSNSLLTTFTVRLPILTYGSTENTIA